MPGKSSGMNFPVPTGLVAITTAIVQVPLPLSGGRGNKAVTVRLWLPAVAETDAPLVFFGPGWGGTANEDTVLKSELASHGYVVAAFDDIMHDGATFLTDSDDVAARDVAFELSSQKQRARLEAQFDRRVRLQAEKVLALLDAFERTPRLLPPNATYSAQRIGVMGMSFGGSTAAEVAQRDPQKRFKAAIDLDGWLYGEAATRVIDIPFALLNSSLGATTESDLNSDNPLRRWLARFDARDRATMRRQLAARPDAVNLTVAGAAHDDFSDELYSSNRWSWWRFWRPRPIAPTRMRAIVDAYVLAFFDQHLKGVPQPLLQTSHSPYAEVTLDIASGKP